MIVGMDFGTTNSGMGVYDGRQVRLLPLDPAGSNPAVARTALYLTNDQTVAIGRRALDSFFEQNVGRSVKLEPVWVGEVEVYGADMYFVRDVYVWSDVLSPGRLFLSIKSGLREADYQGTVVGQTYFSLENLVAAYLSLTRLRAERLLGREVRRVVLGRPVQFSQEPAADALAERRLLEAAFRAGYEEVYLGLEPVAAAYHYAAGLDRPQNILVFDFGGGTLDLTVMRADERGRREVLATGGIPVAGDVFDQKVVRARLPGHFGEGSRYGPPGRRLPLPRWIYDLFSDWQRIIELQTPRSRELLQEIAATAEDRARIEALISLVGNNYSLHMFDVVEAAKRRLSSDMAAVIRLEGPGFHVSEALSRSDFEAIIRAEIQAIEARLDETLAASGLAPAEVDAVIRTGGSSEIPAFRRLLADKFGADNVRTADIFSSVTSGLSIMGQAIGRGELEAQAHTPAERRPVLAGQGGAKSGAPAVNLELLQRRMAAAEEALAEAAGGRRMAAFVGLDMAHQLSAVTAPAEALAAGEPFPLALPDRPFKALLALAPDRPLLLVSSRYRFLRTTPLHLLDLAAVGLNAAGFYHFRPDESVCALADWEALKAQPRLVVVTSRGYLRAYATEALVEAIEEPAGMQFDQPLAGLPAAVLGANGRDQLLLALDSGRLLRRPLAAVAAIGQQAISRREGERLAGAVLAAEADESLLVTADGYAKRLLVAEMPAAERPNSRGRAAVSRGRLAGLARVEPGRPVWALRDGCLMPLDPLAVPLDGPNTTKAHRLVKLRPGEALGPLLAEGPRFRD
ncbi:MAG: Hsp70 family protein [Candidatus Promineifilaceae bacterium]